jgi:hypothetical protein
MAVPITLLQNSSVRVVKNAVTAIADGSRTTTTSGAVIHQVQVVGLSAELIDIGDIVGVPVLLVVKNVDASNYVELQAPPGSVRRLDPVSGRPVRSGQLGLMQHPHLRGGRVTMDPGDEDEEEDFVTA